MLHVNDLTYRIEGRPLFEQATAALSEGWKTGFVGRNGAGKSTLLRLIKQEIHPESGDISLQKGKRLGGVEQEAPSSNVSLVDTVLAHDHERTALIAAAEHETDPSKIADIHTRLADIESHSAEARASSLLAGLGFSAEDQARPCSDFSGGWRMRVALAGVLFSAPDLLLLDEPTNYLDIEGAIWLENYIRRYPYTALIVSHDRDFLNRCVTHILALEHKRLTISTGNYDLYERRRAEARAQALSFKTKQEAKKRHIQSFIDRFQAKASKAKQAQSRIKALEKMQNVAIPMDEKATPFNFNNPKVMAPPIVRLVNANLGYDDKTILKDITLRIDTDDRIVILGPNGEGKSTLVKAISGRLTPQKGNIYKHKKLDIAYFSQHQVDELVPKETAYDHVKKLLPEGTEAEVRSATAGLGFGAEKSDTKVENMSGGEKARLLLGIITFGGPHMIILDEPTNHLDIDARESLSEALNGYSGAVLLITHDAHLAAAIADRLWLVKDGKVSPYDGDLDDYRSLILDAQKTTGSDRKSGPAEDERAVARQAAAAARLAIAPLKKESEALEKKLTDLNGLLGRLDVALSDPNLYEKDIKRATKLQKERGALLSAIETTEENWLLALEKYETAKQQSSQ